MVHACHMQIELTTYAWVFREHTHDMHIQYLHKSAVFTHMYVCMATVASCLLF